MASLHLDANRWSAYAAGSMRRRERRRVWEHIQGCDECRQVYACLQIMAPNPQAAAHRLGWLAAAWDAPVALVASALLVAAGAWWLGSAPVAVTAPAYLPVAAGRAATRPARPATLAQMTVRARPPQQWAEIPQPALPTATWSDADLSVGSAPEPSGPADEFSPTLTGFADQTASTVRLPALAAWTGGAATPAAAADAGWVVAPSFATPQAASVANVSFGAAPPPTGLGWAVSRGGAVLHSLGTDVAQVASLVPLVPGVHFLAFARVGSIIWAAGQTNQVYTSSDSGSHWKQVKLPSAPKTPEGVLAFSFRDPQHGTLVGADGRSWSTQDGGATWTAVH